ncbi:MAG: restriction endonuclease subunit S [Ruminococcus sp.]|nr:restriction endonuclease subunit S [Ruminococcus sp.]
METVKLSELVDIYLGLTHTPEYVLQGVPFLSVKDISNGKIDFSKCNYIAKEEYNSLPNGAKPQTGDMLFCRVGTIGKPVIIEPETPRFGSFVSLGFFRLKSNNLCKLKYLYYWMYSNSFFSQVKQNVKGASQVNLNTGWLSKFDVPLCSIEEQEDIICKLEYLDNLILMRKKQLSKLDELVKSRLVEMFGTIYDNKFGYDIKTLQEVCEQIKDGTHQTPTYTDDTVNGYKFLSSKDVTTGTIDWCHLKYIPKALHEELYARISPRKGDILLAKNGTTGIAAIVDRDEIFDIYVSIALLRPIEINSIYLWAAINSVETKRQFDSSLKGIGVPNLHLGEIKKAKIIVPPLELQKEFATFVEQTEKLKLEVKESLEKLETLKKSLMQKYFG